MGCAIKSVRAQQVFTRREHPGLEAVVITEDGREGRAVCTAGVSIGTHEVKFTYDGGTRWQGKGVQKAVDNVNNIIGPALVGADSSDQFAIDQIMLSLRPNAKEELGGNAIGAVSAAALKAGAASLGIPLYKHIGGENAMYLPVPGVQAFAGHERWGGGVTTPGTKPTHSFMCHGFNTFSEASYAGWEMKQLWIEEMNKLHIGPANHRNFHLIPAGIFKSDEEIWDMMTKTIQKAGYEGRVGIQVDLAADTYYNREDQKYYGIISDVPKTRDALMNLYKHAVANYPFVIMEDPFHEDDYESHAILTKEVDIQIVGDDLFTTTTERVLKGSELGAANTVLLKVQSDRHHQRIA